MKDELPMVRLVKTVKRKTKVRVPEEALLQWLCSLTLLEIPEGTPQNVYLIFESDGTRTISLEWESQDELKED